MATTEYEISAEKWATTYGVRMSAVFAGHRKYFADDKDTRDTYKIMFTRKYPSPHPAEKGAVVTRTMSFDYGASLIDSRAEEHSDGPYWQRREREIRTGKHDPSGNGFHLNAPNRKRVAPSLYDVLTCIEKHEPGTHVEWCSDFGYDPDSRKGLDTYMAVQSQYRDFVRLCNGDEEMMNAAREIQ